MITLTTFKCFIGLHEWTHWKDEVVSDRGARRTMFRDCKHCIAYQERIFDTRFQGPLYFIRKGPRT